MIECDRVSVHIKIFGVIIDIGDVRKQVTFHQSGSRTKVSS